MKEYIERTVAKVKILSWAVCIDNPKLLSKEDTMHCIDNIPAANVAEVRHGRWVEYPRAHYFKCSECKYTVPYRKAIFVNGNREYDYCPSCGARMGKEDEQ